VFGVFLSLIILALFDVKLSLHWSILACAVLGSLAPDVDMPKSIIGRLLGFVSKPLEQRFGHRTVTHSIFGWGVATVLFAGLCTVGVWGYGFFKPSTVSYLYLNLSVTSILLPALVTKVIRFTGAFAIGYVSHIVLDMMTPQGVRLLWPNPKWDVFPGDVNLRPETGSKSEFIIFIVIAVLLGCALPVSQYGLKSSLRWLLATPESAIAEFKELRTRTFVEFKGVFEGTREPIAGRAEVLEVKNKRLVIYFQHHVYTLSDELSADILAHTVRIVRTSDRVPLTTLSFERESREKLLRVLPENTLISGEIVVPKGMDLKLSKAAKTLSQTGDRLLLYYASKVQVQSLGWDDGFELMQDEEEAKVQALAEEQETLRSELSDLQRPPKGLTELGAQVFMKADEKERREHRKKAIRVRLKAIAMDMARENHKLRSMKLVFSGTVTLREVK